MCGWMNARTNERPHTHSQASKHTDTCGSCFWVDCRTSSLNKQGFYTQESSVLLMKWDDGGHVRRSVGWSRRRSRGEGRCEGINLPAIREGESSKQLSQIEWSSSLRQCMGRINKLRALYISGLTCNTVQFSNMCGRKINILIQYALYFASFIHIKAIWRYGVEPCQWKQHVKTGRVEGSVSKVHKHVHAIG
jgi:hypothetical protein